MTTDLTASLETLQMQLDDAIGHAQRSGKLVRKAEERADRARRKRDEARQQRDEAVAIVGLLRGILSTGRDTAVADALALIASSAPGIPSLGVDDGEETATAVARDLEAAGIPSSSGAGQRIIQSCQTIVRGHISEALRKRFDKDEAA